jgi:hypothetical protein
MTTSRHYWIQNHKGAKWTNKLVAAGAFVGTLNLFGCNAALARAVQNQRTVLLRLLWLLRRILYWRVI